MLSRLEIKDFALIENAIIDFKKGFTVLTGETGAGKSILIDAIGAVCGDRANKDLIRSGCDTSVITAVFEDVNNIFSDNEKEEIGLNEDDCIIVEREIQSNGRSYARINGRMVQLSVLRDTASKLVDIHGQNENQSLFRTETQLALLDRYAGNKIIDLIDAYNESLKKYNSITKEISSYDADPSTKARTMDLLKYQIKEISDADLIKDEDVKLAERRRVISNSERIKTELDTAHEILNGDEGLTALPAVKEAAVRLSAKLGGFEEYNEIAEKLFDISYRLEEICVAITGELDKVEVFPGEAKQLDGRIDLINDLKHKYGGSMDSILDHLKESKYRLKRIFESEKYIEELESEKNELASNIIDLSLRICEIRRSTADDLAEKITDELKGLGMSGTVFEIIVDHDDDSENFKYSGMDNVTFLISPNIGEDLKPLIKIASGGEASRVMLAIKTIFAESDRIPLLIFDEIDSGISGRTGDLLAKRLVSIADSHQVFCVTHMAQIAARAHDHIKIDKSIREARTFTSIVHISGGERLEEIARLLSGSSSKNKAMELAGEMLNNIDQ
jgi:DNA repair protein RecN (Recombination protein N)